MRGVFALVAVLAFLVVASAADVNDSWARMYGKGRVFYSSLGHAAETWDNRDVAQMYFEAIKW
jgi:type 1 glutamine amidotransferase